MTGRLLKYWLPVLVWMGVIFLASSDRASTKHSEAIVRPPVQFVNPTITEPEFQKIHFDARKTAHFTEYAILAFLLWRAIRSEARWRKLGPTGQVLIVIFISALYAASDEYHQHLTHVRTPAFRDVLIDTGGAAFGALAYWLFNRLRTRKTEPTSAQSPTHKP